MFIWVAVPPLIYTHALSEEICAMLGGKDFFFFFFKYPLEKYRRCLCQVWLWMKPWEKHWLLNLPWLWRFPSCPPLVATDEFMTGVGVVIHPLFRSGAASREHGWVQGGCHLWVKGWPPLWSYWLHRCLSPRNQWAQIPSLIEAEMLVFPSVKSECILQWWRAIV